MTTPDGSPDPRLVQLRLVGTFAVARGAEPVAAPDLGSRKARLLLKLLAVERPRTVPLERITEVLWEGAPSVRPAQNIATFVSRLRRVLGADVIRGGRPGDRKSTRLNSSHVRISYAVFCLKKKKKPKHQNRYQKNKNKK